MTASAPPDPLGLARLARFVATWPHPAALVGGVAMLARVRSRATRDADLVIVAPAPERALLDHARRHGYGYDGADIEDWLAGGLVRLDGPEAGVDLLIADDPFLQQVALRATPVSFSGVLLPVAAPEDLLLLKLAAARPIDLDDALAIKDALGDTLDRAYLSAEGARQGIGVDRFLDEDI